ncbi:MAG: hypothetical protein WC496_12755 [Phycisphaerae bacterium]|jgi:hypothetical protein
MHSAANLRFLMSVFLLLVVTGCNKKIQKDVPLDKPISEFQSELLNIAFETATSIPVDPHIKDRSKAQEAVVDVCLKLDQARLAAAYAERIDDWRRGLCYADIAFYCAEQGYTDSAEKYIEFAGSVAEKSTGQKWQTDRIKTKIAQTYALLKQTEKAERYNSDLTNSETGKFQSAKISVSDANSFDAQVEALDSLIDRGDFDVIRNTLQAYAVLFDRFYDNAERRSLAEEKIRTALEKYKLPGFIFLELLADISQSYIEHNDPNKALELVNEAKFILDNSQWPLEQLIKYRTMLTELRFRAGETEKALGDADAILNLYNEKKNLIINIYRAEAFRRIARMYSSMGNTQAALSVYKLAVEAGVENPNSRPRAEDLSATCCSMVLYAVEPDAELWSRIRQISESLGAPW